MDAKYFAYDRGRELNPVTLYKQIACSFQMFGRLWNFIWRLADFLFVVVKTFPRDVVGISILLRHTLMIKYYIYRRRDFISIFRQNVERHRNKNCFTLEDSSFTFQQVRVLTRRVESGRTQRFLALFKVEDLTNRLANFFTAEGYKHGDVIALLLDNSLEYPCVWLGLSKIGCITALINTNLRAKPLLHSIATVKAKSLITSKQILSGNEHVFNPLIDKFVFE